MNTKNIVLKQNGETDISVNAIPFAILQPCIRPFKTMLSWLIGSYYQLNWITKMSRGYLYPIPHWSIPRLYKLSYKDNYWVTRYSNIHINRHSTKDPPHTKRETEEGTLYSSPHQIAVYLLISLTLIHRNWMKSGQVSRIEYFPPRNPISLERLYRKVTWNLPEKSSFP